MTYPLDNVNSTPSVTAALVADLFGKNEQAVRADLIRALRRRAKDSRRNQE